MQVVAFVRRRKGQCWGMLSYGQTHQTDMGLGDVQRVRAAVGVMRKEGTTQKNKSCKTKCCKTGSCEVRDTARLSSCCKPGASELNLT